MLNTDKLIDLDIKASCQALKELYKPVDISYLPFQVEVFDPSQG